MRRPRHQAVHAKEQDEIIAAQATQIVQEQLANRAQAAKLVKEQQINKEQAAQIAAGQQINREQADDIAAEQLANNKHALTISQQTATIQLQGAALVRSSRAWEATKSVRAAPRV